MVNGECILFLDDVVTDGMPKVEGVKPLEKFGYEFRALTTISELVRCLLQS